jgi:FRG domain
MPTVSDVRSVQDFLERVWSIPPRPHTEIPLYRGQLHNHSLLPKLFRHPNTPDKVRQFERAMLARLKRIAPHLAPSEPKNDWDWLSLGQHYGMSTRMSDWSANPLVALFFAVELDPTATSSPLIYQYPIMPDIVEKEKKDSPLEIQHTRVFQPIVHSHRSEIQAAWHVVHAIHQDTDGEYRFHPLATMPPHNDRISEIKISKPDVPSIRAELSQMGMTHSSVYSDFGSVCRSIAPAFGLS